jgi:hypothetical protein
MKEVMAGTKSNPLWMAIMPREIKVKDFAVAIALTVAPIGIALLMQKPALRQAIQMRACHASKVSCQSMADMFQTLATKSAQGYQKASM